MTVRDAARSVAIKLNLIGGPVSFTMLLSYLMLGWAVLSLTLLLLSVVVSYAWATVLPIFLLLTAAVVHQIWKLLQARSRVLSEKHVSLMWGTVHLVAWDPTEGILVLRNKNVVFSDDDLGDGRGGVRFVCPILGEEVALRVPLEVQTLDFADHDVLTREYLRLTIRGTMRWRITDIRNFYLLISREMRSISDTAKTDAAPAQDRRSVIKGPVEGPMAQLVSSAVQWLRGLAEAQTRNAVSKVSTGLLLADRVAADLPEIRSAGLFGSGGADFEAGAHTLGDGLRSLLNERLANYGIAIEDVALREIRFPEEVMQQCIEAARAAYLPLLGRREADAKTAVLEREAAILGSQAVGAREVLAHAPALALPDLLASVLMKSGLTGPATSASSDGVAIAAKAAVPAAVSAVVAASAIKASAPDGHG